MSEDTLPRILRKRGDSDYPVFVELFSDLAYVFIFLRLAENLLTDESLRAVAQTAVLLLAAWWVWVLTAWLTDLFDPRLSVIHNLVTATAVGAVVMATAIPEAFHGRGFVFVLAYLAMNLAREAVLIPGTRVNRDIQARTIRVFFWLGVSGVPWLAGAFTGGLVRLVLWGLAVVVDYGSARIGQPTPGFGRTDLASRVFTAPHLAERHRQIVIIALGELVLTSGTGLASSDFAASQIGVFAVSLGSAVLLFHLYLGQIHGMQQPEAMAKLETVNPGAFASYWHLVMVAGVICISAGARTLTSHPVAQVPLTRMLIILAGPALFLFGTCLFDWSVTGWFSWVRAVAALAALAAAPAVYLLPAWTIMFTVDMVLLLAWIGDELITRFRSGRAPGPRQLELAEDLEVSQ